MHLTWLSCYRKNFISGSGDKKKEAQEWQQLIFSITFRLMLICSCAWYYSVMSFFLWMCLNSKQIGQPMPKGCSMQQMQGLFTMKLTYRRLQRPWPAIRCKHGFNTNVSETTTLKKIVYDHFLMHYGTVHQ